MGDLPEILNKIKGRAVLVVGDLMLDTFVYGDAGRISPEAPIPVLAISKETKMLGGAGNVVTNLSTLGVVPHVFAVVGEDENAKRVRDIASSMSAKIDGIVTDPSRPTTTKTRFVASGQQLLRADFEKICDLPDALKKTFLSDLKKALKSVQAVVISDYGKGLLSRDMVAGIIAAAKAENLPVLVDPKGRDFTLYEGADIVTPNRKELSEATNASATKTDEEIVAAANMIISTCGISHVVATRSEDGMSVVSGSGDALHLRTRAREVFDVSGAGDTVIATIACVLAAGGTLADAAELANIAGGIVVGKTGTAPIHLDELKDAVNGTTLTRHERHPLIAKDWGDAKRIIEVWKSEGLTVGLTNGCFDILHYGHVNYLNHARDRCDRLVVGLNSDASVRLLKGPSRPVNDEQARATVIGALGSVDMVVFFGAEKSGDDNTPSALIDSVRPDVIFKGGDYKVEDMPEAQVALAYGGRVEIMNLYEGYSTTATIAKMKDSV